MQLADWRRLLTATVAWLGPHPVTLLAVHKADHPQLAEVIRFAHRLECHTTLVTDGTGIDQDRAEELVDRGLARARVLIAGVSDEVQRAVVGNSALEATVAVRSLVEARADRNAHLDLEVMVPWSGPAPTEVRAVLGWARQVGADGFHVLAPWRATGMPADPELLDALREEARPFNRTARASIDEIHAMVAAADGRPGAPVAAGSPWRKRAGCPVGGQRVEITSRRQVFACPFKTPVGRLEGSIEETWARADAHLAEIKACDRTCAHLELAPEPVLSSLGLHGS